MKFSAPAGSPIAIKMLEHARTGIDPVSHKGQVCRGAFICSDDGWYYLDKAGNWHYKAKSRKVWFDDEDAATEFLRSQQKKYDIKDKKVVEKVPDGVYDNRTLNQRETWEKNILVKMQLKKYVKVWGEYPDNPMNMKHKKEK